MKLADTVYAPPRAKSPWRVEDLYAPAAARYYGHGRNALAEALALAGAAGGRVLLPAFVCRDVLSAVAAAGAEAAYYGVKDDLSPDAEPERWPDARAVVAVDYFGFPQDLAPFEAYVRSRGAVLIEDAAHALFSRDERGRLLGTRAPFGVLSPRKSLTLPNGGALLANDPSSAVKLPPQIPFDPAPGPRAALKAASRPLMGLIGARASRAALTVVRALRGRADGYVGPGADCERVLPGEAPCAALGRPLVCGDPAIEVSRRRALWLHCDRLARDAGFAPVFPSLPEGVSPYAYALRSANPTRASAVFAKEGLTALPWPDLPDALRETAPEHHRNVVLVYFLW